MYRARHTYSALPFQSLCEAIIGALLEIFFLCGWSPVVSSGHLAGPRRLVSSRQRGRFAQLSALLRLKRRVFLPAASGPMTAMERCRRSDFVDVDGLNCFAGGRCDDLGHGRGIAGVSATKPRHGHGWEGAVPVAANSRAIHPANRPATWLVLAAATTACSSCGGPTAASGRTQSRTPRLGDAINSIPAFSRVRRIFSTVSKLASMRPSERSSRHMVESANPVSRAS